MKQRLISLVKLLFVAGLMWWVLSDIHFEDRLVWENNGKVVKEQVIEIQGHWREDPVRYLAEGDDGRARHCPRHRDRRWQARCTAGLPELLAQPRPAAVRHRRAVLLPDGDGRRRALVVAAARQRHRRVVARDAALHVDRRVLQRGHARIDRRRRHQGALHHEALPGPPRAGAGIGRRRPHPGARLAGTARRRLRAVRARPLRRRRASASGA